MPRASYYRKRAGCREGYKAFMRDLYQRVAAFAGSPDTWPEQTRRDWNSIMAGVPRAERVAFAENLRRYAAALRAVPEDVRTEGYEKGTTIPASRLSKSSLLRFHLRPREKPLSARPPSVPPPSQHEVERWMVDFAQASLSNGTKVKGRDAEMRCMAALRVPRTKARRAFLALPAELRRQRGKHDRWVERTEHK